MNQLSPKSNEYLEEKRKVLYWISKWLNTENKNGQIKFDLPEISVIMQLLGFKLKKFEKLDAVPEINTGITIEMRCNKSGMHSVLSNENADCKCPLEENVAQGHFWTVTGCGPSSQENINVSSSSLLPTISKAKSKMIVTLLSGALFLIDCATNEANQVPLTDSTKNPSSFTRSFSLDTIKMREAAALRQKGLKRQLSWEVDPNTSPPVETSSPIPALCASLGQVSLQTGSELVQNLREIQRLASDSIAIAATSKNTTFTKTNYKRVSDIKPTEGPTVEELKQTSISQSKNSTSQSKFETPRRILTPKKFRASSDKKVTPMSGTVTKPTLIKKKVIPAVKASPTMVKKKREDISHVNKKANLNINDKVIKSKIASYVGLTPKTVNKVGKSNEASSSNTDGRFRNVVKATSTTASYKPN